MFNHGLVVGKFYPPHLGHSFLIETALKHCTKVSVILCWKKSETIPGMLRAQWLKKIHPAIDLKVVEDIHLRDDDSEGWAAFTKGILGTNPDAVFTSESYGDPYASFLGCIHILVDKERASIPISATMVRKNPITYGKYLHPIVRAHFARKVCIVGAESTGTTTLSKALAEHYKTVWVPEYGRIYSEAKFSSTNGTEWTSAEFTAIAQEQVRMERLLAEQSNGLVICDTDPFATSIWHERYMHAPSPDVEAIANQNNYDLYIVTGDEIPFVQDGYRDGESIRHWMHNRFIEKLEQTHRDYILVTGSHEDRMTAATKAIDALL
ncbi:MAG: AAA family ATPase [bacterium]